MNRVAVLGSGPGAQATAADLTLMGNLVNMYDLHQFADGLKNKEAGQHCLSCSSLARYMLQLFLAG